MGSLEDSLPQLIVVVQESMESSLERRFQGDYPDLHKHCHNSSGPPIYLALGTQTTASWVHESACNMCVVF